MDKSTENVILIMGLSIGVLTGTVIQQRKRLVKMHMGTHHLMSYNNLLIRLLQEQPNLIISPQLKNDMEAFNVFVDNGMF